MEWGQEKDGRKRAQVAYTCVQDNGNNASVLVRVTIVVMKHYDKSKPGGEGLSEIYFHITVHH